MTPSGAHGHMPHATSGAMLGPIKASQWAMDTTYELLWCIVIGIMTHESLTRRPQQLGSFDIYLLRGPTTIIQFLQGSRVVLNTDASTAPIKL
jgi:hypothetical protein